MARAGTSLERLVASLERVLARDKTVTVESPKRLPDRITSRSREHDVVLTIAQGHHLLRVGIECRDRSRPITVNQVEGYWKKCQDTGIDQGIIVSSTGFYETARMKARQLGMRCLDIKEVEAFDWLAAPGVEMNRTHISHVACTLIPERDGVVDQSGFEILDSTGKTVNLQLFNGIARQQLHKFLPNPPEQVTEKEIAIRFRVGDNQLTLRDAKSGATVPVKSAVVKIRYSVTVDLVPFKLTEYVDKDADKTITDSAVAQLDLGTQSGDFMIVYKRDKGGEVLYVPHAKGHSKMPG